MQNAVGTTELGPTFEEEFAAAGLNTYWLTHGSDGQFTWADDVTDAQKAEVEAFVAQHDPTQARAPQVISDRQFAQQAAIQELITEEQAEDWVANGTVPDKLLSLVSELPQADQFTARMMLKGATSFDRLNPMTIKLTAAFGWGAKERNAFWAAAYAL